MLYKIHYSLMHNSQYVPKYPNKDGKDFLSHFLLVLPIVKTTLELKVRNKARLRIWKKSKSFDSVFKYSMGIFVNEMQQNIFS